MENKEFLTKELSEKGIDILTEEKDDINTLYLTPCIVCSWYGCDIENYISLTFRKWLY